ncbi:hypothetical protein HZA45_02105, partial [Candidatus Peregrinibacteria bacterium]|nr:hypothetical protein [Candidatus Peregrinibacteria bacterium]
GVKTGMRLSEARKICPAALAVPSDFRETAVASEQIEAILRRQCPVVEEMSIDEWFLDLHSLVGGLPVDLAAWAKKEQTLIGRETGLSVSIGVGPSKLLAKMAGEYRKPAGITILRPVETQNLASHARGPETCASHVSTGFLNIKNFLRDRPAAAIPGIGRRRMPQVEAKGWKTAWDIANAPADQMIALCGQPGRNMQRELLGECLSPVSTETAPPKSVSRARSFRPTRDRAFLWAHVLRHLEYTVLKMRRHHLMCRGVSVWLRRGPDADYAHMEANTSLPQPADTVEAILPFVHECTEHVFEAKHSYTQTGLALWRLAPAGTPQFSLFEAPAKIESAEDLQHSIDLLHERFGRNSITHGSALGVKTGTNMELEVSVYE